MDIRKTVERIAARPGIPEIVYKHETEDQKPKVILLLDVSGSVSEYIPIVSSVMAGIQDELQDLQIYYFFNGIYDEVATDSEREEKIPLKAILQQDPDTKIMIYGDGMLEGDPGFDQDTDRLSKESAIIFFRKLKKRFPAIAWLNPVLANEQGEYVDDYLDDERLDRNDRYNIFQLHKLLIKEFPMFEITMNGLGNAISHLMQES
jgi:uncharacterized protein with von Willebrand factor type A (vWA) domain